LEGFYLIFPTLGTFSHLFYNIGKVRPQNLPPATEKKVCKSNKMVLDSAPKKIKFPIPHDET